MLERIGSERGVVYYRSPVLRRAGVVHAFSTRIGGVSPPPFDSLNLGNPSDTEQRDDWERIHENYRRLQEAIGWDGHGDGTDAGAGESAGAGAGAPRSAVQRQRVWVHQVHGGEVAHVRRDVDFESGEKADAIVGDDPRRLLAVRTADCVPILLAAEDGRTVAAIHAGWRGVVAKVVPNAARAMIERSGAAPESLLAAVGPCIGKMAFEVGPEVIDAFERIFGAVAPVRRGDASDAKGRVNLREAVRLQLLDMGLRLDRIDMTDRCTHRDRDEFFSHRRDRGITGRMAALIAPRD